MSYLAQDRAQPDELTQKSQLSTEWEFAEIWVDPYLSPPYILMLITAVFIWVDHSRGEWPFAPTGFWLWRCGLSI
ncbi:MAG: hypothetical protein F6K24_48450 [Okeania sp. SIO2D1]|uniref:hypothetical protein n=1 Tax=Okeania sp. SIO2C9 TaxID=2607791 RepID=UPI0013BBB48A|nr:hypothetical protein [Okeania sp. SIO2C9]NEQ76589.1 hypothetical protein [Okeania sp. SIO2C9]NES72481.1 hypothetical protein [Okeania sp. SIO2D1]